MQKLGKGCGVRTDSGQWEGSPRERLLTGRRLVLAEEDAAGTMAERQSGMNFPEGPPPPHSWLVSVSKWLPLGPILTINVLT